MAPLSFVLWCTLGQRHFADEPQLDIVGRLLERASVGEAAVQLGAADHEMAATIDNLREQRITGGLTIHDVNDVGVANELVDSLGELEPAIALLGFALLEAIGRPAFGAWSSSCTAPGVNAQNAQRLPASGVDGETSVCEETLPLRRPYAAQAVARHAGEYAFGRVVDCQRDLRRGHTLAGCCDVRRQHRLWNHRLIRH